MKIDQWMAGLYMWVVLLAIGYVALFYVGFSVLKDIIVNDKIGIALTVVSMAAVGGIVSKYAKVLCQKKAYQTNKKSNCHSEGTAAFILFMFFSTLLLMAIWYSW